MAADMDSRIGKGVNLFASDALCHKGDAPQERRQKKAQHILNRHLSSAIGLLHISIFSLILPRKRQLLTENFA